MPTTYRVVYANADGEIKKSNRLPSQEEIRNFIGGDHTGEATSIGALQSGLPTYPEVLAFLSDKPNSTFTCYYSRIWSQPEGRRTSSNPLACKFYGLHSFYSNLIIVQKSVT